MNGTLTETHVHVKKCVFCGKDDFETEQELKDHVVANHIAQNED